MSRIKLYIIGLIVLLPDLIKISFKGIDNVDKIDLLIDIIIYVIFFAIVTIIFRKRKNN
jgi:hypothetical protein